MHKAVFAVHHPRKGGAMAGPHSSRSGGRKSGGKRGGRGRGRQPEPVATTTEDLAAWFAGNIPDDWFTGPVTVQFDRDEIVVTGDLAEPKVDDNVSAVAAAEARIESFRETSREARMEIAERAQFKFERKVSWAASCGEVSNAYTVASVPVMTRLHIEERQTLDTLIDAGVARSRSEALAWAVRLVAENEAGWIENLRGAMTEVEELRKQGPASRSE